MMLILVNERKLFLSHRYAKEVVLFVCLFLDSNANDSCLSEKKTTEAVLLCCGTLISFVFNI